MEGITDRSKARSFGLLFALLFAVAAIPVLASGLLPLLDYPNHLARMYLLAHLPHSPRLQEFYALHWRPLPNLAMDAHVPPLTHFVPLLWAGKLFVLLTFLLLAGGVAALHRALFGAWSAWSCLAFLLLYNRVLLWGFLNFLFGLGLALLAFSLWVALHRRSLGTRLAVAGLLSLVVYFAHLEAWGIYGVLAIGYEAGLLWRRRARPRDALTALLIAIAPFLPPLALLLLATPAEAAGLVSFGAPWRKFDLLFSVFDNYSRPFDLACFAFACAGLAGAYWRGWIRLEPRMAPPLLLLCLVFLAMPNQLFTASGADRRLPLAAALVLIGATSRAAASRRAEGFLLGAATAMFLLRLGVVATAWYHSGRLYAALLPAFDQVPPGSRIAVAFPSNALHAGGTPLAHLPTFAIARRDAFVPTLAALPTQQPVILRPSYRALADRLGPESLWRAFAGSGPRLDAAQRLDLERYDYLVFIDARPIALTDRTGLEPVRLGPYEQLYRVAHRGAALDGRVSGE